MKDMYARMYLYIWGCMHNSSPESHNTLGVILVVKFSVSCIVLHTHIRIHMGMLV